MAAQIGQTGALSAINHVSGSVVTVAAATGSPPTWTPGKSWYDTTVGAFKRWNGAAWVLSPPQAAVATGGSTTTIVLSTAAWVTNQWAGYTVYTTGGTGSGQSAVVLSNTGTTLTFAAVGVALAASTVFSIANRYLALLTSDPVQNGVVNLSDAGFTELSISGYARQPVLFNVATTGYPALVSNTNVITFGPISTTMTVPVSWCAMTDVPSGTAGFYLADWNAATPMQVDASQSIQIGIGQLILQDQ